MDDAFDLNHGRRHKAPHCVPNDGGRCVEHERLVRVSWRFGGFFIDRSGTPESGNGCVASGLHLLTQGQLIVFGVERSDGAVRGGGRLSKVFFDNASHRT